MISDTRTGGGPYENFQKSQKFRFFKSCRTLITNKVSGRTQLSKVVTLLKRFGDRLDARGEIRNFLPFFGLTRTGDPNGLAEPVVRPNFEVKIGYTQARLYSTLKPF